MYTASVRTLSILRYTSESILLEEELIMLFALQLGLTGMRGGGGGDEFILYIKIYFNEKEKKN